MRKGKGNLTLLVVNGRNEGWKVRKEGVGSSLYKGESPVNIIGDILES
jgi:hypothetical protein